MRREMRNEEEGLAKEHKIIKSSKEKKGNEREGKEKETQTKEKKLMKRREIEM